MRIEVISTAADAVVLMTGELDLPAASRVSATCDRLAQTDPGRPIVLDFSRVQRVQDVALAALSHHEAQLPCPVRLRGLGQHQDRMLRYLGRAPADRGDGDGDAEHGTPWER